MFNYTANQTQVYSQRFIPGGDFVYFSTHTWIGRVFEFSDDYIPSNIFNEVTGYGIEESSVKYNTTEFSEISAKNPYFILDP